MTKYGFSAVSLLLYVDALNILWEENMRSPQKRELASILDKFTEEIRNSDKEQVR